MEVALRCALLHSGRSVLDSERGPDSAEHSVATERSVAPPREASAALSNREAQEGERGVALRRHPLLPVLQDAVSNGDECLLLTRGDVVGSLACREHESAAFELVRGVSVAEDVHGVSTGRASELRGDRNRRAC